MPSKWILLDTVLCDEYTGDIVLKIYHSSIVWLSAIDNCNSIIKNIVLRIIYIMHSIYSLWRLIRDSWGSWYWKAVVARAATVLKAWLNPRNLSLATPIQRWQTGWLTVFFPSDYFAVLRLSQSSDKNNGIRLTRIQKLIKVFKSRRLLVWKTSS